MRLPTVTGRALAGVSALMMFAACSIQAPNVEFVGQNGAAQGTTTTGDTSTTPVNAGALPGTGNTSTSSVTSAQGKSCLGQATDTGVTGGSIKLGSNFAVSGPVSNISGPILKGVTSYFNKVNESGGIFGRKIDLKWYDDGWDAQRGKGYIKRLVEQDKVFVLSVVPSSNGLDAARTYLEQKNMPVFGTSGLIESQFQSPMQWPVGTGTKSSSRIALRYMKSINARNAAVIWLDLLSGRQAMDALRNSAQKIVGVAPDKFFVNPQGYRVSISEPDFAPVWARIIDDTKHWQVANHKPVDGRPDFVVFAIDPTNAIKALQAAENIGFRPRLAWGGAAPLFLDLVPQGSDYAAKTGLLAGTSYYPPIGSYRNLPAVRDYIATVQRYYGKDVDLNNPYLEGGYAGAALTVEILKRTGPCLTRAGAIKTANALSNFSAAGLTPALTYRAIGTGAGHYGNIRALTVQVQPDGSWAVERNFLDDPYPGAS